MPAIKTKNLSSCSVSYEMDCADLADVDVPSRAWAKHGDIFVLRCAHHSRYIGKDIGRFDRSHPHKPFITEKIIVARDMAARANDGYVAAFLQTDFGYQQIQRRLGGLTANYTPDDFGSVLVPLPDRRIQDYVGSKVDLAERCRAQAVVEQNKLAEELDALYRGCPYNAQSSIATFVASAEIDGARLDAWYHRRHFIELTDWLSQNRAFIRLEQIASLSSERWSPAAHPQSSFRYIEISNVNPSTGHVTHSEVPLESAPSRARKLVRHFDILVSTVRPNRGAVGLVPEALDGAVATTGFAVARTANKTDAFFLLAVLRHPASTAQLMRCNTGSAYPAIEESVLPQIWIPGAKPDVRAKLGAREMKRKTLLQMADDLIKEAKADIVALIEGTLDVDAILSGTRKAPTSADISELAESDA
ncbi:restriction endonuclease subunit S domain-containing protein [Burkholderia cepacia]|uniref:hypothetical protein n=1 Tax=Burkholderia cepacia TaxID=292 RepID=UPI003528C6DD